MKKIWYLVVYAALFFSCRKEVKEEVLKVVEKEFSWQAHPSFMYEYAIQNNSFATDDFIFLLGARYCSSLVADSLQHPDKPFGTVSHIPLQSQLPLDLKFPIGADFFVLVDDYKTGSISIKPNLRFNLNGASAAISIAELDSSFRTIPTTDYVTGEFIQINDRGQVLVPYFVKSPADLLKALLIDTEMKPDANGGKAIAVKNVKVLEIHSAELMHSNQCIGSNFYLSMDNRITLRINHEGNVKTVIEGDYLAFEEIFKQGMLLNAIDGRGQFYQSTDDGIVWTEYCTLLPKTWWFNYTNINGVVIAYYNSQLFEFDFTGTSPSIQELDNYGLEGSIVTSLCLFDHKVYVSTERGVYTRSLETFLTKKEGVED